MATIMAQACAARSYAVDKTLANRWKRYNLVAGTKHQTYTENHTAAATMAVDKTKGQLITYNKRVISAVYHSNCGGRTRNNEVAFSTLLLKVPAIPYLRSVSCKVGGLRYGHGVGMCQHGAKKLAKQGYNYQQIIYHYYLGTSIMHISKMQKLKRELMRKKTAGLIK
jgi:peptidoglycan hydrolase-like amidase